MSPKAQSGICLGPDCTNPVTQKPSGRPRRYCSDLCGSRYRKAHPHAESTDLIHQTLNLLASLIEDMRQVIDEDPREALALHPRLDSMVRELEGRLVKLGSSKKMTVKEIAATMHVSISTVARRRAADDHRDHPPAEPARHIVPAPVNPRSPLPHPARRQDRATDDDGEGRGGGPPGKGPAVAFASALSFLQRASRATRRELAAAAGVDPSYVSRILNGERLPTWRVVNALCRRCQTDPADLRPLWEAARGHQAPRQDSLSAALRGLRLAAARPGLDLLQRRTQVPPADITAVLNGAYVPEWHTTVRLVTALGGEPEAIHPLWYAAHQATLSAKTPKTCPIPAGAFG